MITILCAHPNSHYHKIANLDIYDKSRDAWTFNGLNPVIAHPPCAQWSRLKFFAHSNHSEKELAIRCYEKVLQNGGALEHPMGSSLWKYLGLQKKVISVDQHWFGFPARKQTYIWFNKCKAVSSPLLFDRYKTKVDKMAYLSKSITPLLFNQWLVDSILSSPQLKFIAESPEPPRQWHQ